MKAKTILTTLLFIAVFTISGFAQTTAFTYQGKLSDQGAAANGQYQIEFKLFDAASGGSQIGSTISDVDVAVSGGIFTTQIDFGVSPFAAGENRYVEISVRRNSSESYVPLAPRQPITSAPYAVKALVAQTAETAANSDQLGGINASEYVQTNNPAMMDARDPLPGSANYIQNTTTTQPLSNFNISGDGKANTFSAASQYNIGANRILSNGGTFNLFLGVGSGGVNTGGFNTFVGADAGRDNTAGHQNTFVGRGAGGFNTTAFGGTFVGRSAGLQNTTGEQNTFVGQEAGMSNTIAKYNVFVGTFAGRSNQTGNNNTFVGTGAGYGNTEGESNSFFGLEAGSSNATGDANSFFGVQSGRSNTSGNWNAFFGGQSGLSNTTGGNNSFFGTFSGVSNTTGGNNSFFGIDSGRHNTVGVNNAYFGAAAGRENTEASYNSFFGTEAGRSTTANANAFFGSAAGITNTAGTNNAFFGADAGRLNLTGNGNAFLGTFAGYNSSSGEANTFVGVGSGFTNTTGSKNTLLGSGADVGAANLSYATAIGGGAVVSASNTIVLGRSGGQDTVRIPGLGAAGSVNLCRNANNEISACSSSLRYKSNINAFNSGLDIVNRLKPITFDWKDGGMHDLGLGAEDVAAVDELLVIRNAEGQVEGVKYDRVGVVLLNAVKEQQAQIEALKKEIEELRKPANGRARKARTARSGGRK